MNKPLSWFEIPAADLDRARAFYEAAFAVELQTAVFGPNHIAVFPYDRGSATGGALVAGPGLEPSSGGPILYMNANGALDEVLSRATAAGGKVILPRTELPNGVGFIAQFTDSEGNRIGLHSI